MTINKNEEKTQKIMSPSIPSHSKYCNTTVLAGTGWDSHDILTHERIGVPNAFLILFSHWIGTILVEHMALH